jgi:hypothetical protein
MDALDDRFFQSHINPRLDTFQLCGIMHVEVHFKSRGVACRTSAVL